MKTVYLSDDTFDKFWRVVDLIDPHGRLTLGGVFDALVGRALATAELTAAQVAQLATKQIVLRTEEAANR